MEFKPYLLNWIYNNAKKGAKPPKLQEKEVTITSNTTTTIGADVNYDGLKNVTVTTNINTGDYNAKMTTTGFYNNSNDIKTHIKGLPAFTGTNSISNFYQFCNGCYSLEDVPYFSIRGAVNVGDMFKSCGSLTDNSLNNILLMCSQNRKVGADSRNLKSMGLSSTQATRCESLSNWDAFVNAGWSSGY